MLVVHWELRLVLCVTFGRGVCLQDVFFPCSSAARLQTLGTSVVTVGANPHTLVIWGRLGGNLFHGFLISGSPSISPPPPQPAFSGFSVCKHAERHSDRHSCLRFCPSVLTWHQRIFLWLYRAKHHGPWRTGCEDPEGSRKCTQLTAPEHEHFIEHSSGPVASGVDAWSRGGAAICVTEESVGRGAGWHLQTPSGSSCVAPNP